MAAVSQSPPVEQRIILDSVSWDIYEGLLTNYLDRRSPRFAYDQGVLEIVRPSPAHEETNLTLAMLVEMVAYELRLPVRSFGTTTYKREELQRGFEPDSSFYIKSKPHIEGKQMIDLAVDPPPDLIIEIDDSNSSLNKLPIYARLGIPEVWRYERANDQVTIFRRRGDSYRIVHESAALVPLNSDVISRFVIRSRSSDRVAWIDEVRAWVRDYD